MINTRTRNAPARIASGTVIHHDTFRVWYMRNQSSAEGTSVLTICQDALAADGCWYWTTILFHSAQFAWDFPWGNSLLSFITCSLCEIETGISIPRASLRTESLWRTKSAHPLFASGQ